MSMRSFLLGALAMLLLIAAALLILVLAGGYNVAASDRHAPTVAWALDTTFINLVQRQSNDIEAPKLTAAMVAAGAPEYKSMCEHCHGGVGESRAGWAQGMRPKPPPLAVAARKWSPAEVFWLVKHGAKMTGMPAFGPTHDDKTIWNIAAFVKALPLMSAETYARFPSEHPQPVGGGGHSHAEGTAPHHHH